MVKVSELRDFLEQLAPPALKMDFDNVGLLVGCPENTVTKVLVALDITIETIEEASALGAELIVAHHPLFFKGPASITPDDLTGRKITRLLTGGISAICMHTNLDAAIGGVSDTLSETLGGRVTDLLDTDNKITRIAELPEEKPFGQFLAQTCQSLQSNGLRYHDAGRPVRRLGVCGGSGGEDIEAAFRKGCDTFVTADVKYHQFLLAKELGINLIDGDHFCTENVIVPVLAQKLAAKFKNDVAVTVSRTHHQTAQFYMPDRI